jgi:peptidyl-prolyl cis-trans isomerase A (cyclophilin A)
MRNTLLMLALFGCGSPEMEAENQALKDEVSKLTADYKAADRQATKLGKKVRSLQKKLRVLKAAATYGELGIETSATISAVFYTSLGTISCDLMPEVAPKTVLNFVQLAEGTRSWEDADKGGETTMRALYSGTIFHRVIPKFMIQGGDPQGTGRGGPGYKFEDETSVGVVFDTPGLLAMANSGPNTNGSQFFITDRATPTHLNGKHTIFGACKNLDVIEAIASVKQGARSKPEKDVVLNRVEIRR